jgi:plasmid stabilization system protein ParE
MKVRYRELALSDLDKIFRSSVNAARPALGT